MAQPPSIRVGSTQVDLEQQDITGFAADAIVNAANQALAGGGGVDGAIHAAAGPALMRELRGLYTGCPTGSAVITGAGRLAARHVIHAVGPIWRGGAFGEADQLASSYTTSLDLAAGADAATVAFPAIGCGVYGYPVDQAAPVAVAAVRAWLIGHPETEIRRITFVLRGPDTMAAFTRALESAAPPDAGAAAGDGRA
ncbi:MAG: O-acetyl-ADP-ribose deacetylase [Chloroflexota bacterium]|jgi:O-acetyl-ADP-ribose deacetylase (regulator of RNase III)|nr:O-acetyl-ADP-ribose deacetylase [Chloroflexota bacterium]